MGKFNPFKAGKKIVEKAIDIVTDIVDVVFDIVEDVIGWLNPIPDIPDFSDNIADQNARGV